MIPDSKFQRGLLLVLLILTKFVINVQRLICKHSWDHDLDKRTKKCTKCGKSEEVFMGWV